jgi:hypothetical protein
VQVPDVELALRTSRLRRLTTSVSWLLAVCIAPAQALRLESPWPLLLLIALPLVLLSLPECVPRRLRIAGAEVEAFTAESRRVGCLDGPLALTRFALEVPVRWDDGRHDRIVVWRDAVDDADYRRLARILRRPPGGEAADPPTARS